MNCAELAPGILFCFMLWVTWNAGHSAGYKEAEQDMEKKQEKSPLADPIGFLVQKQNQEEGR